MSRMSGLFKNLAGKVKHKMFSGTYLKEGTVDEKRALDVVQYDPVSGVQANPATEDTLEELKTSTDAIVMLISANRSSNGDTQDLQVDVSEYREALFFLEATAKGGTSPTLTVNIETENPASGEFYTHTSFTQLNDAVGTEMKALTNLGSSMAVSWVIGGSDTPNFTFAVYAVLKK